MGSPGFFRSIKGVSISLFIIAIETQMASLIYGITWATQYSFVIATIGLLLHVIVYAFDRN